MLSTPHLEGSEYQNPDQVARHVLQKCMQLNATPSGVPGIRRLNEVVYVTMTGLPRGARAQDNIRCAVQRAFGMNGTSARGANPHPAHDVIIDVNDNHVRVYTTHR